MTNIMSSASGMPSSPTKKKSRNRAGHIKDAKAAQASALSASLEDRKANEGDYEQSLEETGPEDTFAVPPAYQPARHIFKVRLLRVSSAPAVSTNKLHRSDIKAIAFPQQDTKASEKTAIQPETDVAEMWERLATTEAYIAELEEMNQRLENELEASKLSQPIPATVTNGNKVAGAGNATVEALRSRLRKYKKLAEDRGNRCMAFIRSNRSLRNKLDELHINMRPAAKRDSVRVLLLEDILAEHEERRRMDKKLLAEIIAKHPIRQDPQKI
ncbi:hypothetical protein M409DRAFT_61488 [Zasmidium cellare ATCC 36951]|uniref:Uncharacterized protein n=1 Tax=Zasmidium cellare ATCC 36951 TaxID=1080233 RepID=A0A6A6BXJ6_ZASCE|nr:uncharacterized protein M409DRAFT_61488 [Zasmidium cellare ATCC 36951]KAF2158650.1 hypothetical protein M409DRAFT_61488 [Zasmidium cellare ATCC 36951]